jgi:hypothetical protein
MDKCDLRHLEFYTQMKKKNEQEQKRLKNDLKPCNVFEGIPKKPKTKGKKDKKTNKRP